MFEKIEKLFFVFSFSPEMIMLANSSLMEPNPKFISSFSFFSNVSFSHLAALAGALNLRSSSILLWRNVE
jgi:hypothetical protein